MERERGFPLVASAYHGEGVTEGTKKGQERSGPGWLGERARPNMYLNRRFVFVWCDRVRARGAEYKSHGRAAKCATATRKKTTL